MNEADFVERSLDGVAVEAILPQLPAMRILVTGDAARVVHQPAPGLFPAGRVVETVAVGALFHLEMPAGEGIAGLAVIEGLWVEGEKLDLAALVLGMTGEAGIRLIAVESTPHLNAPGQILVTGEALGFCGSLPRGVAGNAVAQAAQLSVGLAQGSGRDEKIELLAAGAGGESSGHHGDTNPRPRHHLKP